MIVQETMHHLRAAHGQLLASERVERLVVGLFFTAVQLSGGSCGVARTETERERCCAPDLDRNLGEFSPGRLKGRPILEILEHADSRPYFESIKLAILNAVSARLIEGGNWRVVAGCDPIERIDVSAGQKVTLIGAFLSYMDRLAGQPCRLRVLELDPAAFPERHRSLYVPAAQAPRVLADSDTVVLTGSTLVNRTLDDLLASVPPRAFKVLVGPSGGLLPDALFRRGIDLIGTIRILDPEVMFGVVGEAGVGYHLFRSCAEKICISHG